MKGKVKLYKLANVAVPGAMPEEKLVFVQSAFFDEVQAGVTRLYLAKGAHEQIDLLIRLRNVRTLDPAIEYAIVNGDQYRVTLKTKVIDEEAHTAYDLTLERLGANYDVSN